jgi:hypothetical protein
MICWFATVGPGFARIADIIMSVQIRIATLDLFAQDALINALIVIGEYAQAVTIPLAKLGDVVEMIAVWNVLAIVRFARANFVSNIWI